MFKNFSQRLKRDLKSIVDSRVALSESASGGHMRVSLSSSLAPPIFDLHATRADSSFASFALLVFWSRSERHFARKAEIRCLVRRKFDGFAGESNSLSSFPHVVTSSFLPPLIRLSRLLFELKPEFNSYCTSKVRPFDLFLLVTSSSRFRTDSSSLSFAFQADYEEYGPSIVRKFSTFGSPH